MFHSLRKLKLLQTNLLSPRHKIKHHLLHKITHQYSLVRIKQQIIHRRLVHSQILPGIYFLMLLLQEQMQQVKEAYLNKLRLLQILQFLKTKAYLHNSLLR
ncbi:hypothetical protein CBL_09572 [Carabus blaptoides fortunei]